jgi:hypothetical protein
MDVFGAARRTAPKRTVKSCGPDASTLALSRRSDPPAMVATKPDHQGELEATVKTVARGMLA